MRAARAGVDEELLAGELVPSGVDGRAARVPAAEPRAAERGGEGRRWEGRHREEIMLSMVLCLMPRALKWDEEVGGVRLRMSGVAGEIEQRERN